METPATAAPLFRHHVRRPRLTKLLDESTAQAIVITAPAGYGKTTLAEEWLRGKKNVAWYRASAASADVAAFSVGVAEAVRPFLPRAGDRLMQRVRVGDAPEKAVRSLAELLAEDFERWPPDAWLVVDDYHLVSESTPVEDFVDWLLTLAPVRMIVTSRRRPSWASARRVLYGEITEITREHLAMTSAEATLVLDGRPTSAVRALVGQAEGWPALIGLAALSGGPDVPSSAVSQTLFRYFAQEFLRTANPNARQFLLVASVPRTITVELIRDVFKLPDSQELLASFEDDGLLHKVAKTQLRFHPLLRTFLRRELESEDMRRFRQLRTAAIDHALESHAWEDAFDLAVEAGDDVVAAKIVGEAAPHLLVVGRVETIEKWLSTVGAAALRAPGAVLAQAEVLTRKGHLLEARTIAENLARRLEVGDARRSRAWFLAGQASHIACDYASSLQFHLSAEELATTPDDLRNAVWGAFLSVAELESGSLDDYHSKLEEVASDDLNARIRLATARQVAGAHDGSFAGIWKRNEPVLDFVSAATDVMAKSNFLCNTAYLAVARADYPRARELASAALDFCSSLRIDFGIGFCLAYRGEAEVGARDFRSARVTLDQLAEVRYDDPHLDLQRAILLMKFALSQRAPQLALEATIGSHDVLPPGPYAEFMSLRALAAAASGDPGRAFDEAAKAQALTNSIEAKYFSRFALLLNDIEDRTSVSRVTEQAASLVIDSEQDEFLNALVISYRAYPALLSLIAECENALPILRRTLSLSNDAALARSVGLALDSDRGFAGKPHLTRRETEVFALMAEGLSNAEIASRLVISPSTAKVHIHHILAKLGAKSRLHAVLRADELL